MRSDLRLLCVHWLWFVVRLDGEGRHGNGSSSRHNTSVSLSSCRRTNESLAFLHSRCRASLDAAHAASWRGRWLQSRQSPAHVQQLAGSSSSSSSSPSAASPTPGSCPHNTHAALRQLQLNTLSPWISGPPSKIEASPPSHVCCAETSRVVIKDHTCTLPFSADLLLFVTDFPTVG